MAVEKDSPPLVQKFQGGQADTGKFRPGGKTRLVPVLGPIGTDKDDGTLGNAAVNFFPGFDVGNLEGVAGIGPDLGNDGNDDQLPQGIGRGQFIDGGIFRRPVRGRIELGAKLIGGQRVGGGFETIRRITIGPAGLGDSAPEQKWIFQIRPTPEWKA